jgi:hypothetical protein
VEINNEFDTVFFKMPVETVPYFSADWGAGMLLRHCDVISWSGAREYGRHFECVSRLATKHSSAHATRIMPNCAVAVNVPMLRLPVEVPLPILRVRMNEQCGAFSYCLFLLGCTNSLIAFHWKRSAFMGIYCCQRL